MENQFIGRIGEDAAQKYLLDKRYVIVGKNFRAKRYREVDIIAQHPDGERLVFVEVKTRLTNEYGLPEEAVGLRKLRELKKMVDYYYNIYPNKYSPQIDVIAIMLTPEYHTQELRHLENVTL